MSAQPTIGLIRANLPRYFPEKHGVWDRVDRALDTLSSELGVRIAAVDGVATNAAEARKALAACEAAGADFVLLVHGGFTMGDVGREVAASRFRLGVWTVPEPVRTGDVQLNNFVSLNMTLSAARLVRDMKAVPVQRYHGAPHSPSLIARLATPMNALIAVKALEGARIGVVGGLAMTFYNMEVSTNVLRQRLGLEVAHHDMHELTGRMEAVEGSRIAKELAAMREAAEVRGVCDRQMDLTARCALALRDIAAAGGCDALAVSDWPALQEDPGMHPGSAFSWLEEVDMLPCASEGDVLGAATQLVARSVTGKLGTLLDMTEPDFDCGRLLMWHGGGGPLHMADANGAAWINHPMIGRESAEGPNFGGVADFVFAPGRVTVFRIAREAGAFFQMTAEVVPQDPSGFDGCRGWMDGFSILGEAASLGDVVATVMVHGIEHHFVAVPGVHAAVLGEFAAWARMTPLARRRIRDHLALADYD